MGDMRRLLSLPRPSEDGKSYLLITQMSLDSLNLDGWKWNKENWSITSRNHYGQNV